MLCSATWSWSLKIVIESRLTVIANHSILLIAIAYTLPSHVLKESHFLILANVTVALLLESLCQNHFFLKLTSVFVFPIALNVTLLSTLFIDMINPLTSIHAPAHCHEVHARREIVWVSTILLILNHPHEHLLLIRLLLGIYLLEFVNRLASFLFFSLDLHVKEILKSLKVQMSCIWWLNEPLLNHYVFKPFSPYHVLIKLHLLLCKMLRSSVESIFQLAINAMLIILNGCAFLRVILSWVHKQSLTLRRFNGRLLTMNTSETALRHEWLLKPRLRLSLLNTSAYSDPWARLACLWMILQMV